MAPWAELLYAADAKWWRYHHGAVAAGFRGERWTQDKHWQPGEVEKMGLAVVHCEANRHDGLSTEPGVVHSGHNSGYQLINLAWHHGYRRLLLLGYDLQRTGGKAHWFGDHPTPEMRATSIGPTWISAHNRLAGLLARYDLTIINCTRETALTCYPRMTIEQALA